ncbi:MAG: hypothetical protein LBL83_02145 [Clostridiales bacterium]|nr:hypothetical protein [Clostridiales bacterium]
MIKNYGDFCAELIRAGFSIAGGNDEGVFSLIGFDWRSEPQGSPIRWHTGDPDTDPWEWRVRVLKERDDIAYGKVFFRKGGFVTREWYPYFLAARRSGRDFADLYADGLASHSAKRVYGALSEHGELPVHEIRALAGFGKDERPEFERAVADLQMGLFITMCGQARKRNKYGEEYGWNSMALCLAEQFWDSGVFEEAEAITAEQAEAAIAAQAFKLNPAANPKKVRKFIYG